MNSYDNPFWGFNNGGPKKKWNNYQKKWPPTFMPAAKGSAHAPLGPKIVDYLSLLWTNCQNKI